MAKKMMFLLLALCFLLNTGKVLAQRPHYGRNIIGLDRLINNSGTGFGINYQRIIGQREKFSLGLALSYCLGNGGRTRYAGEVRQPGMFNIEPAFRYYPHKTNGIVRYGFGGMLLLGFGEGKDRNYLYYGGPFSSRSIVGLMVINSLHIQPIPQLRISLEFGIGPCSDNNYESPQGVAQGSAGLAWRL
jgi:hypothetical protein